MDTANTASQINLMEMAKQGDLNALAALMNRSLRVHSIFAELNLTQGCLVVSAMFEQSAPNKTSLVDMLKRGLTNIYPKGVQRVMIQAMSIHDRAVVWQSAFVMPAKTEVSSGSALNAIAAKIPGLGQGVATATQPQITTQDLISATSPEVKSISFKGIQKQAIGGYLLLIVGLIMMFTGLGQQTQSASNDNGSVHNASALANKAIHSEAGGALMISGAILIATRGKHS